MQFYIVCSPTDIQTMRKLLAFLCSALTFAACHRYSQAVPAPTESTGAEIVYEDIEPDDSGGRLAASSPNQSIIFQAINSDLSFTQVYTWKAWHFGTDEPAQANRFDGSAIDKAGDSKRDNPTYTVTKSNLRLYASKSMKPGWYLATNSNGASEYYKFQVVKGAAGLLTLQEENNPARFNGYSDSHGKVKISMWNRGGARPGEADFVIDGVTFHLFSRDGLGVSKYQTFCLPVGTYPISYQKSNGQPASGLVAVTQSKTTHIKAIFYP